MVGLLVGWLGWVEFTERGKPVSPQEQEAAAAAQYQASTTHKKHHHCPSSLELVRERKEPQQLDVGHRRLEVVVERRQRRVGDVVVGRDAAEVGGLEVAGAAVVAAKGGWWWLLSVEVVGSERWLRL